MNVLLLFWKNIYFFRKHWYFIFFFYFSQNFMEHEYFRFKIEVQLSRSDTYFAKIYWTTSLFWIFNTYISWTIGKIKKINLQHFQMIILYYLYKVLSTRKNQKPSKSRRLKSDEKISFFFIKYKYLQIEFKY